MGMGAVLLVAKADRYMDDQLEIFEGQHYNKFKGLYKRGQLEGCREDRKDLPPVPGAK